MPVVIEQLGREGLYRFSEIDRSEDVRIHYRMAGRELVAEEVIDPVPNFLAEGEHHSIPHLVGEWQPVVDAGGVLLGAFDGDRLVAIALLGNEVAPGVHQLALLFVSRPYRRSGVASLLLDEVERLALSRKATAIYVSSVPSDSAVGFYRSRGFELTEPLPDLWAKEPDDIHMVRALG
jgi:GNAT superfamily N-acetyltransferase